MATITGSLVATPWLPHESPKLSSHVRSWPRKIKRLKDSQIPEALAIY